MSLPSAIRMERISLRRDKRLVAVNRVRLAATVMLARPPFEVYLARRSAASAFAPDAFVFPGGTIEAQDGSEAARARTIGLEPERIATEFRATVPPELPSDQPLVEPETAGALCIGALRELFEEAGVLLARTPGGAPIDAASTDWQRISAERAAVRNGACSFAEFLAAHDWYADARAVRLFSHWVTPPSEPRRYDTHFFLAAAPFDQAALADACETHDGLWIAPADALARAREGTMRLVYPTIKHLQRLAHFRSVEAAFDFAGIKPVLTVMPRDGAGNFEIPASLENAW
jgi:8-oxo-dGTP pyrophosphatase MutT (NUDIX family)